MKLNPHEDMTPEELGQAARRTGEAKAYAAGRMKGFPGLTLTQFRAARSFIESDYLRQVHEGQSPYVSTEAINDVLAKHGGKAS